MTSRDSHKKSKTVSPALNWLVLLAFAITPWLCRATLYAHDLSTNVNHLLWGLTADLYWAALLTLVVLTLRFGRYMFTGLTFLLWNAAHIMDAENIIALGQLVHHSNLPYLLNAEFLGNTVNALPGQKILLNAGIFGAALLALFFGFQTRASLKGRPLLISLTALVMSALLLYQALPDSQQRWQTKNFFALHLDEMAAEALNKWRTNPALETEATAAHPLFAEDLNAHRPEMGRAKNVLIIALEGIPGAYLKSATDYLDYPATLTMPGLSALAEGALVVPNFVSHRNQTNRGLYSILCSDYPKLLNVTPKPMELLSNNTAADRCLPRVLRKQGYSTHYFQAADLQFMSKGTVMPFIGFDDVRGKESFNLPQGYYFSWGPDDELFFEQSLSWLRNIDQQDAPWLATLLTVGTHHPYAIKNHTLDREASQGSQKYAAVLAADRALTQLIKGLKASGLSENTLILITSDESHGVPEHRFGGNWGLMVALAPDINAGLNEGVFGSVDTTLSVLDYLNIHDNRPPMTGRSIFRHYEKERSMLFSQPPTLAMSEKKGEIILCPKQAQSFLQQLMGMAPCEHLLANNQQIFSDGYTTLPKGKHLRDKLVYSRQKILDSRLQVNKGLAQSFVFNQNTEVNIGENRSADLLSGQYLSLPRRSTVRLELDLSFEGDSGSLLELNMSSIHRKVKQSGVTFLAPLTLPTLLSGERLRLDLSFATLNAYNHGQTILRGISRFGAGKAIIHSYKMHIEPNARDYTRALTINNAVISRPATSQTHGESTQSPLRLTTMDGGLHYNLVRSKALKLGETLSFSKAQTLALHSAVGFWPAEDWGSWTKQRASINISMPEQAEALILRVAAQSMPPPGLDVMPASVFINNIKIATWNVKRNPLVYSAHLPRDLSLGSDMVVRFELDSMLATPQMLDAKSGDTRELGLAIKTFSLSLASP